MFSCLPLDGTSLASRDGLCYLCVRTSSTIPTMQQAFRFHPHCLARLAQNSNLVHTQQVKVCEAPPRLCSCLHSLCHPDGKTARTVSIRKTTKRKDVWNRSQSGATSGKWSEIYRVNHNHCRGLKTKHERGNKQTKKSQHHSEQQSPSRQERASFKQGCRGQRCCLSTPLSWERGLCPQPGQPTGTHYRLLRKGTTRSPAWLYLRSNRQRTWEMIGDKISSVLWRKSKEASSSDWNKRLRGNHLVVGSQPC